MAERKTPRRQWETNKIVTSRLVNRLQKFIMFDAFTEPPPAVEGAKPKKSPMMTDAQVHATLGLLKKYLPDLKSVAVTGDPDHPVVHEIRRVIVDPVSTPDAEGIRPPAEPE